MSKLPNLRLSAAIGAMVMLTGITSVNASTTNVPQNAAAAKFVVAENQPVELLHKHRESDTTYIVRLADPDS